ncbi:YncE family protein, partial [Paracoccus sp. (in: a-proteobacteria)]|uniref:YncE family protein n=1 Tax=Paracoccus sp. TaxID=267 RepID=UPI00391894CC
MTLGISVAMLGTAMFLALPAFAESPFIKPVPVFPGGVYAEAPDRASPVLPGGTVRIDGDGMVPGQQVTLMRGTVVLNPAAPITVDAAGKFVFDLAIDADAQPGLHPVVVLTENPSAARIVEVRISREVPVSGIDLFSVEHAVVAAGPYQAAWSPQTNAVFVTSTVGRGAGSRSAIERFDAASLTDPLRVSPAATGDTGIPFAVYGAAVDDANGNLWVTTTQQDTVAVYRQSDLSLVRQFPVGQVPHARDVVVDERRARVFVSSAGHDDIYV